MRAAPCTANAPSISRTASRSPRPTPGPPSAPLLPLSRSTNAAACEIGLAHPHPRLTLPVVCLQQPTREEPKTKPAKLAGRAECSIAAEEGLRVATEAAAQDAGMPTPLLEAVRGPRASAAPIGRGEIAGVLATAEPGERRPATSRTGPRSTRPGEAVGLAAGRPPLVAAVRPEQPLEVVVGARQLRDGVAVEQAGAVAAGHLEEVVDGTGELAGLGAVAADGGDQPGEAAGTAAASRPAALARIRAARCTQP